MEPVPGTSAAFASLSEVDGAFETYTREIAHRIRELVPETVGMSIALAHEDLTFTLVATDSTVAGLDALQYLAGGPCVSARHVDETEVVETGDLLDEGRWQVFARGEALAGIESTLSLPLTVDDEVVGSLNLYASSPSAYDDMRHELAELVGAWEPGVVANADLGFTTLLRAATTPLRLEEQELVDRAVGILAAVTGEGRDDAVRRLRQAAVQAGIQAAHLARLVIDSQSRQPGT